MNKSWLYEEQVDNTVDHALAEDISHGDVTSELLIPPELQGKASILTKADGIIAGGEVAKRVFLKVDPSLKVEVLIKDGAKVKPEDKVATIFGKLTSILKAERVALNFLSMLSGIASQTAHYVAQTNRFPVNITDTRKTTPGLRLLEKYAVGMGGGHNHRFHLGDGVLIKDNHIAALRSLGISLKDIVARAKQDAPQGLEIR